MRQPSTLQLAQYGQIAIELRKAMKAKGLTASTLNQAMGLEKSHASIYGYLNGKTAPSEMNRERLAKALDIDPGRLIAKPVMSGQEALPVSPMPRDVPSAQVASSVARKAGNSSLLSFTVDQAGMAHMQFSLQMALPDAIDLLNELQAKGLLKPSE